MPAVLVQWLWASHKPLSVIVPAQDADRVLVLKRSKHCQHA